MEVGHEVQQLGLLQMSGPSRSCIFLRGCSHGQMWVSSTFHDSNPLCTPREEHSSVEHELGEMSTDGIDKKDNRSVHDHTYYKRDAGCKPSFVNHGSFRSDNRDKATASVTAVDEDTTIARVDEQHSTWSPVRTDETMRMVQDESFNGKSIKVDTQHKAWSWSPIPPFSSQSMPPMLHETLSKHTALFRKSACLPPIKEHVKPPDVINQADEKPFACKQCSNTYSYKRGLLDHIDRIHEDQSNPVIAAKSQARKAVRVKNSAIKRMDPVYVQGRTDALRKARLIKKIEKNAQNGRVCGVK